MIKAEEQTITIKSKTQRIDEIWKLKIKNLKRIRNLLSRIQNLVSTKTVSRNYDL